MQILTFVALLSAHNPFVTEASASTAYELKIPRDTLRVFVDDMGLFARHMPGVVSVQNAGPDRFLYVTEKVLPLAGTMRTEFDIRKRAWGDSAVVYESVDPDAENYMCNKVTIRSVDTQTTSITIDLRIRLRRERGGEVHWLAPILGEEFISERMTDDLKEMLETFIQGSSKELYDRFADPRHADR
jgi:carbon monoxide dehydrogenase subunit G